MQKIIIILASFVLLSCGVKRTDAPVASLNDANSYLNLAKNSAQPEKSQYLLKAAVILAQRAQYLKAQETFSVIKPDFLTKLEQETYFLYYGVALQHLSQTQAALKLLRQIQNPEQHPVEWQIEYQSSLAQVFFDDGNYLEAAKIRINLEDLLMTEAAIKENHQFIWHALSQLSADFLKLYQSDFSSPIVNGWMELAYLTRMNSEHPEKLLAAIEQWRLRYPIHPANEQMPEELQLVANAKIYKPKQVALLLPLSGRLASGGRMIRDGFFAAHYTSPLADDIIIKVYDTALALSATSPYQQAIDDGADFIVGPLTKEAVEEIAAQENHPVPQLSLNLIESVTELSSDNFQFGLPIEDEARQIAQVAIAQKHETAIILAPDNEQGQRTVQAFREAFELLNGQVAEVQWYNEPEKLKDQVQQLLNIDNSEERARRLKQILGVPVEYVQRRRQDADMVFLAATPTDARRIKPFLNYYYAQDLPVFSVSRINSGDNEPTLNTDLNGIVFTDSPLLISAAPELQQLRTDLKAISPGVASSLGRLFALGFDAYSLIPDLNVLRAINTFNKTGLTGRLTVNAQGKVTRSLSLAEFKNGIAREREMVEQEPQQ
ncbi:MAG: penicillin-binding protein activator [Gammaproteobacteria bacterium]|nr:penicillin-binding protein activator [Gammaproteobacteria bacterium]